MSYVVQRREDGHYLTPPGSKHSYTKHLRNAHRFNTRVAAEATGLCDNERVITLEEALDSEKGSDR